jgi:hypothetical protein
MPTTGPPSSTGPHTLPPLNLAAIRNYFHSVNSRLNLLETNRPKIPSRLAHLNDSSPMAYAQEGNVPTYQQSTGTYVPKPVGSFGFMAVASTPALGGDITVSPLTPVTSSEYNAWASLILLPFAGGIYPVINGIILDFGAPLAATMTMVVTGVVSNVDGTNLLAFARATTIPAGTTAYNVSSLSVSSSVGGDLSIGGVGNISIFSGAGGVYAWQVWVQLT